jgi:hypothetical protein
VLSVGEYEVRVGFGDKVIVSDVGSIVCCPVISDLGFNLDIGVFLHGVLEPLFDKNRIGVSWIAHDIKNVSFHLPVFFFQESTNLTGRQNTHPITAGHRVKINFCFTDHPIKGNDGDALSPCFFNTIDNRSSIAGGNDNGLGLLSDRIIQLIQLKGDVLVSSNELLTLIPSICHVFRNQLRCGCLKLVKLIG